MVLSREIQMEIDTIFWKMIGDEWSADHLVL